MPKNYFNTFSVWVCSIRSWEHFRENPQRVPCRDWDRAGFCQIGESRDRDDKNPIPPDSRIESSLIIGKLFVLVKYYNLFGIELIKLEYFARVIVLEMVIVSS